MKVLDLFCGGGGAAAGMLQAGCNVIGVDIDPLCAKWYPAKFIRHDVFTLNQMLDWQQILDWAELIWASPVCRRYSTMTQIRGYPDDHPDQIKRVRELLEHLGKPFIIENVPKAPLRKDVELCGLMFNLPLYRHRIFECSFPVRQPPHPKHAGQQKYSVVGRVSTQKQHGSAGYQAVKEAWPAAMGITHIGVNASTTDGHNMFSQAIPPAFSKYLIEQYLTPSLPLETPGALLQQNRPLPPGSSVPPLALAVGEDDRVARPYDRPTPPQTPQYPPGTPPKSHRELGTKNDGNNVGGASG